MKKLILLLLSVSIVTLTAVLLISCGGGSGSSGGGASAGSVALFATDSPEDYKQVTVTINSVQLVNTGTGATCDVLTKPVTLDITDLASVLQLLNVVSCPSENFNRIYIEFNKQVVLTDANNITTTCNFESYKDEHNHPNVLQCPNDNSCFIDINGAVNVFASQNNKLALDFDLKEFEVEHFNSPSCSVTMKVSPLNASDIDKMHDDHEEGISGYISNLDTDADSFTLTTESGTFTVSYTAVTTQGIDDLLKLAVSDQLQVEVIASGINLDAHTIEASAIYVELEGTISKLDTLAETFTLTYQTDKTITVDYKNAEEEGTLADGANVEVKLNGYDGTNYLANEVEVEGAGV